MRGIAMGLPLLVLLVGCRQTTPEPVPDFVTYTPKYVDVVTAKMDQTTSGLTGVKSAVQENTEVLLQIKELVAQKPAAGGVEPRETPSSQESSPPPAPPTIYITSIDNCAPCRKLKKDIEAGLLDGFDIKYVEDPTWSRGYPVVRWVENGKWMYFVDGKNKNRGYDKNLIRDLRLRFGLDKPTSSVQSYRQQDLVRLHDDIHNAESGLNTTWTWGGDLKTHLERDHGVEL